ncbi:MAG: hypothetical protein RIC06_00770 [Cyclobacteriaceae bacterium]
MKLTLAKLGFILITFLTNDQSSPEPVSHLFQLIWEVESTSKNNALPALRKDHLYTDNNFTINVRDGRKVPFSQLNENRDSILLVNDHETKLEILDLKSNNYVLNTIRKRARYIGQPKLEFIKGDIWVEVDYNMNITAINIYTKKKLWSTKSSSRIVDKPISINNKVYVVNEKEIIVLNKINGEILSQIPINGQILSELTIYNNYIYFIIRDIGLIAYNALESKTEWIFEMANYSGHINRIIISDEEIYFADNNLYAIDRIDGNLIWKLGSDDGVYIKRPDHVYSIKDYLVYYQYKYNENLLTVSNKNTGQVVYQGPNSSIIGGDSNNPDGIAIEDLLFLKILDGRIDNKILIGVMDDKVYGIELLN